MIFVLSASLFSLASGFLIENMLPRPDNASIGTNQFLTVAEYYNDKLQMRIDLDQIRQEQDRMRHEEGRTLNFLASQIIKKFENVEDQIREMSANDTTLILAKEQQMEKQYQELYGNLTEIKTKLEIVLLKYKELENNFSNEIATKVAMDACVLQGVQIASDGIITFVSIKRHLGMSNMAISSFQRTGKFKCEISGLYFISSTVTSNTSNARFYIARVRNNSVTHEWQRLSDGLIGQYSNSSSYHTGTAIATVELEKDDQIYVETDVNMYVYGFNTCITVLRIK